VPVSSASIATILGDLLVRLIYEYYDGAATGSGVRTGVFYGALVTPFRLPFSAALRASAVAFRRGDKTARRGASNASPL
jgi:hypothetical protein